MFDIPSILPAKRNKQVRVGPALMQFAAPTLGIDKTKECVVASSLMAVTGRYIASIAGSNVILYWVVQSALKLAIYWYGLVLMIIQLNAGV